jgi:hypothetical protein
VANQQKDIATQIVAAEEFPLQEFVLFWFEGAWKVLPLDFSTERLFPPPFYPQILL